MSYRGKSIMDVMATYGKDHVELVKNLEQSMKQTHRDILDVKIVYANGQFYAFYIITAKRTTKYKA